MFPRRLGFCWGSRPSELAVLILFSMVFEEMSFSPQLFAQVYRIKVSFTPGLPGPLSNPPESQPEPDGASTGKATHLSVCGHRAVVTFVLNEVKVTHCRVSF